MRRVSSLFHSFTSDLSIRRRPLVRVGMLVAAAAWVPLSGCTQAQTTGLSPSYLIIDAISAASGATPTQLGSVLASDVVTMVKQSVNGADVMVPTIYEDTGEVKFRLALKDPGSADEPSKPSPTNFITVNRYHVQFIRSDGRNAPGVDVPYAFDGAITVTVTDGGVSSGLTLVRAQAKQEAPLITLVGGGGAKAISTIAQVTFYGSDQAGRAVSAVANISVNFADWGDPASK